jgi:hypothetical protein
VKYVVSRLKLFTSYVGYGSYWGLTRGCGLGIAFSIAIFQLSISIVPIVYFAVLGMVSGIFLGGLIAGILSIVALSQKSSSKPDRLPLAMLIYAIVISGLVSPIFFYFLLSPYFLSGLATTTYLWHIILPTITAVGASAFLSSALLKNLILQPD